MFHAKLSGRRRYNASVVSLTEAQNVFVFVLAAGEASRFGSAKQLAPIDGDTLVGHALDVASQCGGERTVLVVGHEWREVRDACRHAPGFLIVNERFTEGLGASIAAATRAIAHAASGIIVTLADQPLVTAAHLNTLRDRWSGSDREIVATAFGDAIGPPALFPRACFDDLASLSSDAGGRQLFDDDRFTLRTVRFEDAAVDIDTRDDLASLRDR